MKPPSARTVYAFTVCTPTFDRAHTLPRVFESLKAQSFRDFEWIVVDDGSADGTADLVENWQQGSPFPIRYFWQKNSGMGVALNKGIDEARGFLFLMLDSDDECLPWALERLKLHWESIPADARQGFVGVTGLVQTPKGKIVGARFPSDVFDSDSLELRIRFCITGEKWGCQRTDVLRVHKFPIIEQETCVFASTVWNRIALKYKTRFVNDVFRIYHDTPGSMSALRSLVNSPRRGWFHYRDFLWLDYKLPLKWILRINANYVRYSLHSRIGLRTQASEAKSQLAWITAFPIGLSVFLLDRIRISKLVVTAMKLVHPTSR